MEMLTNEFAARPALIRHAIDQHTEWIEKTLNVPLSQAVIVECDVSFVDAAIPQLLRNVAHRESREESLRVLASLVESVEIPRSCAPLLQAVASSRPADLEVNLEEALSELGSSQSYSLKWDDGPVAFQVRGIPSPIVAIPVSYHAGTSTAYENVAQVLIFRREASVQVLGLIEKMSKSSGKPKLHTQNGLPQRILPCDWDQLVLDPSIAYLLKNDFQSFFQREPWFRKMRLPFRRGYLLHGPPGNGKSTAIRAMLTSAGLAAYTIRLFDSRTDDEDMERLFERVVNHAPGVILFEDIDRAFPRTGGSKSKVSLQQLLNCLDPVATGEGIVIVATANNPTALDPAILKRPGRFDRVIHFPNPSEALRREYFCRMHQQFVGTDLNAVVSDSDGFSFAQLREAYIMAGQLAFEGNREICLIDLTAGVRLLRETSQLSSTRNNRAGFVSSSRMELAV